MSTKVKLLSQLDTRTLRKIASNEGIKVPSSISKKLLIQLLSESLTLRKIKTYVSEVEEEVEREVYIKEKVKRRGRTKVEERVEIALTKEAMAFKLLKERIPLPVIEYVARWTKSPIKKGPLHKVLDSLNDSAIKTLYKAFIRKEHDRRGRFLELRTAAWLAKQWGRKLSEIKIDYKIPSIGEIDVVGLDSKGNVRCMAECKARAVTIEDVDKWIGNIRRLSKRYGDDFCVAYMVTSDRYTQGVIERVKSKEGVDPKDGRMKMATGILYKLDIIHTPTVWLKMYEERGGNLIRIFPK